MFLCSSLIHHAHVHSYYQYSAGSGFGDIEGYDLFDSSKGLDLSIEKKKTSNSAFIVHGNKATLPDFQYDSYAHIDMSMKGSRFMDEADKRYIVRNRSTETIQSSLINLRLYYI